MYSAERLKQTNQKFIIILLNIQNSYCSWSCELFLSGVTGSIRVDRTLANKKLLRPLLLSLTDEARNAITAEYCLLIRYCIICSIYYTRRFLAGHPYPVPTNATVVLHKFRADLFVFLFVWRDLDPVHTITAVSVYLNNATGWYRLGYHQDILRLIVNWWKCFLMPLLIYSVTDVFLYAYSQRIMILKKLLWNI